MHWRDYAVRGSGLLVLGWALCGFAGAQTTQPPTGIQKKARASNMDLVGYNDLQNRSAYQPIVQKQGDRWIAYVGHHGGEGLNPLTGKTEPNGTSIVDVTNPKQPKYLAHIPGEPKNREGEAGGASMVRVCSGNDLPHGVRGKFYLLRAYGNSSHEIWDVTDPAKPSRLTVVVDGLRDTHKNWWECDTGIAYLVSGPVGWRVPRMAQIYDLSDPAKPVFIRNFGLPGQEPGARGPTPDGLHGAFSTGPKGNRVYFAYGNARDGVIEIVDREKLLNGPKEPTEENLKYPIVSRVDLPSDMGAHNIVPMLQMQLPEFAKQKSGKIKDFLMLIGETTPNECQESRQMARIFDITTETKAVGVSTWTVPEDSGNFCTAGGRFGTHSTNESLAPVYYNRVMFVAHFNAGVRAVDVRDPYRPREIGFYIPAVTDKTDKRCVGQGAEQHCKIAIQTNNVDVDDRGYIYAVDRANTGMHIVELAGTARQAADFTLAAK
ncbi:MAG TPA: hypothetical protein VK687_08910 [Bryobacteraceae bacterium]|nr:hypothetical protein [Bryobacteraceae bacterium]